jgi:hypothetical protein
MVSMKQALSVALKLNRTLTCGIPDPLSACTRAVSSNQLFFVSQLWLEQLIVTEFSLDIMLSFDVLPYFGILLLTVGKYSLDVLLFPLLFSILALLIASILSTRITNFLFFSVHRSLKQIAKRFCSTHIHTIDTEQVTTKVNFPNTLSQHPSG